ncbi:MAG: FmdB family zinc ribbon protein [Balneolales bacterium]
MPTYQYLREDGSTFEIMQSIKEDALKTCPDTGQKVKRVITGGSGVVYKGDGWYVTDYKNKKQSSAVNDSTSGEGKTGEGKAAATEEKPAAPVTNGKAESKE